MGENRSDRDPALQTTEIFGQPVFKYTYREAVIEGYLVDHDAPHDLHTKLRDEGIHYQSGDTVTVSRPGDRRDYQQRVIER